MVADIAYHKRVQSNYGFDPQHGGAMTSMHKDYCKFIIFSLCRVCFKKAASSQCSAQVVPRMSSMASTSTVCQTQVNIILNFISRYLY